ncbi:MAG: transposase [Clostridia bacterium]|nr:MAG: transposase [Clostridia bacterium]
MKKRKKNKKKAAGPNGGIIYTVQGEWFPKDYPAFRFPEWHRGNEDPLVTEMRLFSACVRWAFNRLLEGKAREELKKEGQELFGLNSRYVDDAILKAKEIIGSQQELLALEIEETQKKLGRAKKKLDRAEKDLDKAKAGDDPGKIEKAKRVIHGRRARARKLSAKLAELQAHQENGTIPKVVFGGKSLWRRVCKGQSTREEWRNARQNRLYARGDETKGGNPNLKLVHQDGEFTLSAAISHLAKPGKIDAKGVQHTKHAPRVTAKLWLPEKHRLKVWELLLGGVPYTVELIRGQDGRYRAHITFAVETPRLITNSNLGYLGMDTNPDGVALANIGYFGQPEPWPEGFDIPYPRALHKFAGEFQVIMQPNGFLYIKIPELAYSRGYRRTYLIGVLAQVVVDITKVLGKPMAVENLDFGKDRLDTNKRFNRMAANFPYRKVIDAVMRKAFKEGVSVKSVWPAHTSTAGYWKYMERYGVVVHQAAALVIARRATGFKERITEELKQNVEKIKEELSQKVKTLPGEGKGMTRKVKRLFRRLDEKILVHNGLTRFKQESFYSVWHDLKELALSSR